MRTKVEFSSQGQKLAGLLETPDSTIRAYVLFAHCFTCGKDIAAASRISRFLVQHGFAVFRFDFTGLGNSDGDFANTNFSSNTEDLLSAATFLEAHYEAPKLLIGHSLVPLPPHRMILVIFYSFFFFKIIFYIRINFTMI